MMFLDCPAYLDQDGTARCGLPAEVRCKFTMGSTDGPLESAMISCPAGHWFNGPIEFLTCQNSQQQAGLDPAVAAPSAKRDSLTPGRDGPEGTGRSAAREATGQPDREILRPSGALAYYLGRPARLWITAMRPRHPRAASHHLTEAATGG
jgi:hypothetical protein